MKNNRLTSFAWKDDITREELKDGYYSDVFGQTFACKEDGNRHACTSLLMLDGWEMKTITRGSSCCLSPHVALRLSYPL